MTRLTLRAFRRVLTGLISIMVLIMVMVLLPIIVKVLMKWRLFVLVLRFLFGVSLLILLISLTLTPLTRRPSGWKVVRVNVSMIRRLIIVNIPLFGVKLDDEKVFNRLVPARGLTVLTSLLRKFRLTVIVTFF